MKMQLLADVDVRERGDLWRSGVEAAAEHEIPSVSDKPEEHRVERPHEQVHDRFHGRT